MLHPQEHSATDLSHQYSHAAAIAEEKSLPEKQFGLQRLYATLYLATNNLAVCSASPVRHPYALCS